MADRLPALEWLRAHSVKTTKSVKIVLDSGEAVKTTLTGVSEDTVEGLAKLAEAQKTEIVPFARDRVAVTAATSAAEKLRLLPRDAGTFIRTYSEPAKEPEPEPTPEPEKKSKRKGHERGGIDPALIPTAEVAPTDNGTAGT